VYDFATHTRTARVEVIQPGRYILVEGLFVLYWPPVRTLLATKVFVDLDDRQCLERRIRRDVAERGRTAESVTAQFQQTVRPMAEQYIRPTHEFADLIVRGDDAIDASVSAVMAHVDGRTGRPAVARGRE
jgi:uridine kinase